MINTNRLFKLAAVLLCGALLLAPSHISWSADDFYVVPVSQWKRNGTNIYYKDGNVGIGTNIPQYPLHVSSTYVAMSAEGKVGMFSQSHVNSGIAIQGRVMSDALTTGVGGGVGVFGINGNSGEGVGVRGEGYEGVLGVTYEAGGCGVRGVNSAPDGGGIGVKGEVLSGDWHSKGVYGKGTAGFGVVGESTTGYAVFGNNLATTGTYYGVVGTTASPTGAGVHGYNSNPTGKGIYGIHNSTSGVGYGVYGWSKSPSGYGVYCEGNFAVTGAKNAIVATSKGNIKLYAQESPEVWFEDFGEGTLKGGMTRIELDPLFLETVTIDERNPLKVFIQLNDDCNGVYVQRQATGFEVKELRHGNSNASFTYRVVAKRKGYETARLEAASDTTRVAALNLNESKK